MTSTLAKALDFNINDVLAGCRFLSGTRKKLLTSNYKTKNNRIPAEEALYTWLEDQLCALKWPDNATTVMGILLWIRDPLKAFATKLVSELGNKDKLPVGLLSIADNNFIAITGEEKLLNVNEWEWATGSTFQFLSVLTYNLTTLFLRHYMELEAKKVDKDDTSSTPATVEG